MVSQDGFGPCRVFDVIRRGRFFSVSLFDGFASIDVLVICGGVVRVGPKERDNFEGALEIGFVMSVGAARGRVIYMKELVKYAVEGLIIL